MSPTRKTTPINIPFVEVNAQIPNNAKFVKNIMSNKNKLEEFEMVNLIEECYVVVLKKLSPKLRDPRCFSIPCTMSNSHFKKALCDLGASINLMSYYEPQPTNISLQLVNRTITHPLDITEDVLVKVGKFIFPTNFVILDMEEDDERKLTLRLGNEEVDFKFFNSYKILLPLISCNCVQALHIFNREISGNNPDTRKSFLET
ncbi:hypothetical protein CR513_32080, partial [Mucuna pruriens]